MSEKINDLSNSALRKKYFDDEFIPENNLSVCSIRVSTKKQERGKSLEEQQEITDGYKKKEKLLIEKTWVVAETASNHEVRRHFHEMIAFVKQSQRTNRPIKHALFSHQSRSSRNKKSARELEELVELGVTLHFARDNRKLDPKSDIAEWMMWLLENIRNEAYIDDLRKNVVGGAIKCIERGLYPNGTPPYGYKSIGRKDKRHFVLDGLKGQYMKAAFEIVLSPIFSQENLTDKRLKEKLDGMFSQLTKTPTWKQLNKLLRNPFYTGEEFIYFQTLYKADPELQPCIVSKARWLRAREILSRRKGRKLSAAHPYIGLMTCKGKLLDEHGQVTDEICGCAVTAEQIRRVYGNGNAPVFNYYRCSNQVRRCSQRDKAYMKKIVGRDKVSYTQEEVEIIFQNIFKSFSFDEVTCQRMKKYLWKEHFEAKAVHGQRLTELQARQVELNRFIETAYEDKLKGVISEQAWRGQDSKWQTEHRQVIDEISSLKDSKDGYMERGVQLIELFQNAEIIYQNATPEKKRKMVELVSSNLLFVDGSVEFQWRMPFNLLAVNGSLERWCGRQESNLRPSDS
jgi:hypothetical protein